MKVARDSRTHSWGICLTSEYKPPDKVQVHSSIKRAPESLGSAKDSTKGFLSLYKGRHDYNRVSGCMIKAMLY